MAAAMQPLPETWLSRTLTCVFVGLCPQADTASDTTQKQVADRQVRSGSVDDSDNRLFGVTVEIAWTPKPAYQLTVGTPLYAVIH
jgi:hypothetical protein